MKKYKVQCINKYSGSIEDDCVSDLIFDNESEAEDYALECSSSATIGAEILQLNNPGDYEEDYGDEEDYEYIVVEVD